MTFFLDVKLFRSTLLNFRKTNPAKTTINTSKVFTNNEYFLLGTIVTVSFFLRFTALETPSMWWDEILVPMTARYPLSYIFEWARTLEVNSPYYIVFVKFIMLFGKSDFCLRLTSAAAGVFAILAIAHIGKTLFDKNTGLIAALLFSAWPLHILLSRQLRPYALFSVLVIISIFKAYELATKNDRLRNNTTALTILYALLFSMHYMAAPLILSQGVFLTINILLVDRKINFKKILLFSVAAITSFALVSPFFFGTFLQRKDMLGASQSYGEVLARVLVAINHVCGALILPMPLDDILPASNAAIIFGAFFLISALGCCLLIYTRDKTKALLISCTIFVPLIFFIATRQNIWRPRHLSFLMPSLALAFSYAFARIPSALNNIYLRTTIFGLLLACSTLPAVLLHKNQLYLSESYPDVYKSQARQIAGRLPQKEPIISSHFGDYNAIAWYLDIFMDNNPLTNQTLGLDQRVKLHLITAGDAFSESTKHAQEFMKNMGQETSKASLSKATIYSYDWDRTPLSAVKPNETVEFSAKPWLFYRFVSELQDVTINWRNDPLVHATKNNTPCSFTKKYTMAADMANAVIDGSFSVLPSGGGSSISSELTINDQTKHSILHVDSADTNNIKRFRLIQRSSVSTLAFKTKIYCGVRQPAYPGSNLDTVGFRALKFSVTPIDEFRWGSLTFLEQFSGLDPQEESAQGKFRWAHGPETSCTFVADSDYAAVLDYSFSNPLPDQGIDILLNGNIIKSYNNIPDTPLMKSNLKEKIHFLAPKGENTIIFRFKKYNGLNQSTTFAPDDSRPLAAPFAKLRIDRDDRTSSNTLLTN